MAAVSRTSIVAMLVAVEVLVAGLCIWSVTGLTAPTWSGGGFHRVDYVASPIAPIAAGDSPVVVIDDEDSHVIVSASTDGLVHVTDKTVVHGWIAGSDRAQVLTASRTPDGVRVFRPPGHFSIGATDDKVLIAVPPMSRVQIIRADRCDISGIRNGASIYTNDGHITATDVTALSGSNVTVNASTSDGSIAINGNRHAGSTVKAGMGDAAMTIHTEDGSIHITTNGA